MAENTKANEQLKADIKQHYYKEYRKSVFDNPKGMLKKFLRFDKPESRRDKFISYGTQALMYGAMAGGGVIWFSNPFTATLMPLIMGGSLIGAPILSVGGLAAASVVSADLQTEKALSRDIANGTLLARYNNEVLTPKIKNIAALQTEQKAQLETQSQQLTASSEAAFNNAIKEQPQPTAPKRKGPFRRRPSQPAQQA